MGTFCLKFSLFLNICKIAVFLKLLQYLGHLNMKNNAKNLTTNL